MKARLPLLVLLGLLASAAPITVMAQTAFEDAGGGGSASGSLVAVEPEVQINKVALGSTTQAIIRFRNDSAQPIPVGDINIYPSSNVSVSAALNQCSEAPLQFGGECAIVMAVKALKAGTFQTQILIQHSGRSKLITASIVGEVEAAGKDDDPTAGEIQGVPAILDFGTIVASRPTLRTLQLRNTTSDPLDISSINFESPSKASFDVRSECKSLLPGQSCLVSVVWSPLVEGPTSGFLVINHTGTSKITNIPVQGIYQPAAVSDVGQYPQPVAGQGLLVSSAKDINFGDGVDTESAVTLTLVNGGDTDLTLKNLAMSVITPGLAVDPSGCRSGSVIKPNAACALTLRWAPQKIGSLTTDLRIEHNGTRGIMVIPVKGKATAVVQGGLGYAAVAPAPLPGDGDSTGGTSTDLPGSLGLTLNDIDELNAAMSGDIADVITRTRGGSGGGSSAAAGVSSRTAAAANAMASYIVTSHSINRAVLMGPNGSRIVTHNKPISLEGATWKPVITPDGVDMKADGRVVKLAFDGSLAANQALLTDNSKINEAGGDSSSSAFIPSAPASSGSAAGAEADAQPAPAPIIIEDSGSGGTGLPEIF